MTLLLLEALVGIAVFVEVLNLLAREFFAGVRREDALREDLRKLQEDLAEASKRIASQKSDLRKGLGALDGAKNACIEVEKEMANRQRVEPVMVYLLGPETGVGFRFRAPLTKALAESADAVQKKMWSRKNFVEVWVTSEDRALAIADDQFAAKHGYKIGPFERTGDSVIEKAA
ncbi:MAG: hypothetical protein JO128_05995 [Alphaproteobacteria bacterium]|nr:hypothetical protein [Alphaproteobacteria bacterium]